MKNQKFKSYYPNDFILMLLSLYSEDETGCEAGKCQLEINQIVSFSEKNENLANMKNNYGIDLNQLLEQWSVLNIIDDKESGYLGLILENQVEKQLVLSHRSTNFKLSLKNHIVKQSGVQCDVQGVVKQGLTNHQAAGYKATKLSHDISKNKQYSLSFCGHSLGAWLAELSVYYCQAEFDIPCYNVKAVTFDGPGSWEMMKKLDSNHFKGQGGVFKKNQLEIINYFSAPNLVNCLNTHVGIGYRLYPQNIEINQFIEKFSKKVGKQNSADALASNKGHDLKYLLHYFDPITGKPNEYALIKKWPKIKYCKSKNNSKSTNVSTLKSLVVLVSEWISGKLETNQFWDVHNYLSRTDGYKVKKKDDYKQEFYIQMRSGYQESQVNLYTRKIIDKIDEYLAIIFDKKDDVEISEINENLKSFLKNITNTYKVTRLTFGHEIIILLDYRSQINIDLLRDQIRIMLRDYKQQFLSFLDEKCQQQNNNKFQCFIGRLCDNSQQIIDRLNVFKFEELFISSNIIAIIGPKRIGKTILAYQFALELKKRGAKIWPFNYQSEQTFMENVHFYVQNIKQEIKNYESDKGIFDLLVSQIESSNAQLVLIIDNIEKDFQFLEKIINKFPKSVKIILISSNSLLFHTTQFQIIKVQPFSEKECLNFIDFALKGRNIDLTQKAQLIALSNKMPEHLSLIINYINSPQNIFRSVTNILSTLFNVEKFKGIYTPLISLFENEQLCQSALQYLAWLDPENIQINILRDLLHFEENDEQIIDASIEKLYSSSLISLKDEDHITIQQPIQDECRKFQFTIQKLSKMLNYFVKNLPSIQTSQYNKSTYEIAEYYIKHITNIIRIIMRNQETYIQQQNDQHFLETLSMLVFKLCIIHQYILINYQICKSYYDFLIQLQTLMNQENSFITDQFIRETFLLNKINLHIQIGLYDEALKDILDNLDSKDNKITNETQIYLNYEMACLYSQKQQYYKSSKYFMHCLNQFKEQCEQQNLFISKCHLGLAVNQYLQTNYLQAFYSCLIAQNIATTLIKKGESLWNSQILLSQIYKVIGTICQSLANLETANLYFEKAISILKNDLNNFYSNYQIDLLVNFGLCLKQMKQQKESKKLLEQSIKSHSNIYVDFKIQQLLEIQYQIGIIYLERKKFEKAQNKFELILHIGDQKRDFLNILKSNYQLGVIEKFNGNPIGYLSKLENICKELKNYQSYFHPFLLFYLKQLGDAYREFLQDEGKRIELYQQLYFLKIFFLNQKKTNDQDKDNFVEIDFNEQVDRLENQQFMDDQYFLVLEKRDKDFYQKKITRDLIKASGVITQKEYHIKQKIQITLSWIQQYAFQGKWKKETLVIMSESIKDLISVSSIKTKLGAQFDTIQDLKIAFMLCFESLNIGIVHSNFKYINFAAKFFQKLKRKSHLQNLLEEMVMIHPEYFIDLKILQYLQKDQGIPFQTITIDSELNQKIKDSIKKQQEQQKEIIRLIQENSKSFQIE